MIIFVRPKGEKSVGDDIFKKHFADGLVMIELQGQLRVSNNDSLNGFDLGGLTLRKVSKHMHFACAVHSNVCFRSC